MGEGQSWTVTFFRQWVDATNQLTAHAMILCVLMLVCVCVCVCSLGYWLVRKANGTSGDQSISVLWLWLKSSALLTPLILLLSVDMDQETVSHPSIAFCLTVCNINKKIHAHLHLGLTHCAHAPTPTLHSACTSVIVFGVWLTLV